MKRYSEYKQVDLPWLKEIPSHWEMDRGKNYIFYFKELNTNNKEKNVLSLTLNGVIRNNADKPIGLSPKDYATYQLFQKDDLVFKLIDLNNVRTSRVGIVNENGIMSSAYIRGIIHSDLLSPRYYYYWYYKLYIEEVYNKLGSGVRETINQDTLFRMLIPIPPKEEQNQIANYLDWKINEIDRLIEKEKILFVFFEKFFESKCESLIKHVILDLKLKFKLRHLARFQNGISESGDFFTDGFPFVSYSDVYNNTTLPSEVKGKAKSTEVQQRMYSVNKGDIFVTRTSETIDDAIFFSLCEKTIPNSVFSGFLIRIRLTKSFVLSKYLLYYLKTTFVRTQILKNLNLVTRVSVGQSLLKDIEIKIPDKEVQEYVIQTIDEMSNKIEEVKKRINEKVLCLQKLKQSLISEVVTGKIDVRDIEIQAYEKVNLINKEPDNIEGEEE